MRIRKAILEMQPYQPPLAGRDPHHNLLLDFNECLLPPPSHVLEALKAYVDSGRLQAYPDYGAFEAKLAAYLGVSETQVLITNGSDQGIEVLLRALLEPADELIIAKPTFAMYAQVARSLGAKVVAVPHGPDMTFPLEAMMQAVTPATRAILVANPNNPTGTSLEEAQLIRLLETFPQVAVLVDEAYFEFSGQTAVGLLSAYANLAVLRTFSKAFALPALRLGVVVATAEVVTHLKKIRGPYDVNMMAVVAAQAQLDNPNPWRAYVQEVMTQAKPEVEAFLTRHGVQFFPSRGNFILIRMAQTPQVVAHLKTQGILVRPQPAAGNDFFRVTLGPRSYMIRFMEAMKPLLSP